MYFIGILKCFYFFRILLKDFTYVQQLFVDKVKILNSIEILASTVDSYNMDHIESVI